MSKKKGFVFVLCCLLMFSVLLAGCGGKDDSAKPGDESKPKAPIELKLGTKMPPESIEGQGFQKFADLVKEKSNGELKVIVYPSEQLGDTMTQVDSVLLGSQDMYAEGSTYFSRFEKDFNITSIPYLFSSNEHYQRVVQGSVGQRLNEKLISHGLRILNTDRNFVRGPYRVLCSTFPVRSIDDVQGLRMRTFDSAVYMDAWINLGANPLVIAWTETYLAIRQNVVQAVTSPISLVYSMAFTEVAPYVTVINEFPQDVVIVINNNNFLKLSQEHQQILIDAANEAGAYATQLTYDGIEEELKKMRDEHGAEFIEIDTDPFREKMADFFYSLEDKGVISKGLIDEVLGIQ